MSSHLSWMIIRNNNSFLVKKRNIKKPFSKEANNLTNLSSFRYNGYIHKKTVGIEAGAKKGFAVVTKRGRSQFRPAKAEVRNEMTSGPRRSLHKLRRLLIKNKYRRDLNKAALRRASAVLAAQKALPVKKPKAKKAE